MPHLSQGRFVISRPRALRALSRGAPSSRTGRIELSPAFAGRRRFKSRRVRLTAGTDARVDRGARGARSTRRAWSDGGSTR